MLLGCVLGWWLALPSEGAKWQPPPEADEIEIVASNAGFRPGQVGLRRGETVRIVLTTADDEHCFAVDALRIEKRILPGRRTTLDLTPERAGTFPFYSCLEPDSEKLRGRLTVSE